VRILAVIVAVLLTAPIANQTPAGAPPNSAQVAAIEWAKPEKPLEAGETVTLNIAVRIERGWHINSNHPRAGYYIPTRLKVKTPPGVTAGTVAYPPAKDVTLAFARDERLSVFTGRIEFKVPLTASVNFKTDIGAPATFEVDYQACNDHECLRPASTSATIDLASVQSSGSTGASSGSISPIAASASRNPATKDSGDPGSQEEVGIANIFAMHGYVLGFLVVLLGGLALNLTPCVYPLIGVTIAYFGNQGGAPRKVAILAMIYVFGIALMFSGMGVAVALSGGLFGRALQNPYVLTVIAAMLLALAASSFGFFSLQPPQWMMRRAGTARPGYIGALTMGLGMGVVAAPCIGPIVLGLLLMVQRSRSAVFGFALFFTLAVGLGLPYVALALAAGSIRSLPRSGEWLSWVEQLFGFVLVGLALYFIDPVVPGRLITRFLPYYAAIVGVFLGFISPSGRNWRPFLFVRSAIGVISLATLVYLLVPSRIPRKELAFAPFNLTLVQAAQTERKPVVVDFAADWCVPCREMERTTFVDPTVVRAASGFVLLKANLTAENGQNEALMKRFNIQGVPTTLFIDANGKVRKRRVGYVGPDEFLHYLHEFN
jgi:thiol:disulfide interchange protein DsbD